MDAMERSNHNNSGHGKSTAQVIKELRASNSKLSAKTADMEAEFMNQMNEATMQFQATQQHLEEALKSKEQQIATLESRGLSAENRLRERDAQVSKLKEDTTFQRHTIADLKNQLYQLQHEIEDAEYDKCDEVDKWAAERQEMQREMDSLRRQLEMNKSGKNGKNHTSEDVLQNWKQLEETMAQLSECRQRLHETQSQLATVENDSRRAEKDFKTEIALLKANKSESRMSETVLQDRLTALEQDNEKLASKLGDEHRVVTTLESERSDLRKEIIELNNDILKLKTNAESQDKYRKDEADDLRLLNDAQRDEVNALKIEADEMEREIAEKDEAIQERNHEIERLTSRLESLVKDAETAETGVSSEGDARLVQLQEELKDVREASEVLKSRFRESEDSYTDEIAGLKKALEKSKSSGEELESRLIHLQQERDEIRRQMDALVKEKRHEEESRSSQRLREVVASAARDRADLESDYEKQLLQTRQKAETELLSLQAAVQEKTTLVRHQKQELEQLQVRFDKSQQSTAELERKNRETCAELEKLRAHQEKGGQPPVELRRLREKVKLLEGKRLNADKAKKQLREAQIALVALDDEKKRLVEKHLQQMSKVEREKEDQQRTLQARLSQRDVEVSRLTEKLSSEDVSTMKDENEKLKAKVNELKLTLNGASAASPFKDTEVKLANSLQALQQEHESLERKLREKLEDRDTTISALVKSSVSQEHKVVAMKAEIADLKLKLTSKPAAGEEMELPAVRAAREAEFIDEIETLRSALDDYKEVEARLHHELSQAEQRLSDTELEAKRLREQQGSDSTESDAAEAREKLQERDAAIANLVKQSMGQEELIAKLKSEMATQKRLYELQLTGQKQSGPSWEELKRLQKESEIFAGQIIEQDEEIEALRHELSDRNEELASVERELAAVRRKMSSRNRGEVTDLRAQVDEMQEANETQRVELRDLRKQLRDAKSTADEAMDLKAELDQANLALEDMRRKIDLNARDDASLRKSLDQVTQDKEVMQNRLSQQMESVRRLRNSAVEALEQKVREGESNISSLETEVASRDERVASLETEVVTLKASLALKDSVAEETQSTLKQLKDALEQEKSARSSPTIPNEETDKLRDEVGALKRQLSALTEENAAIEGLREKLQCSEDSRVASEQSLVDSYERKLSLVNLNKDVTIDGLRKDLAETKAKISEVTEDYVGQINSLEMENKDLKDELDAKLQLKNTKIHALEQTLGAQEQLIDNMRSEMDHLQSTMERTSLSRRAEIEEMQQEMIDTSSNAQRQEREITVLKMALEESRLDHKAEVSKLKDVMASLERSPQTREVSDHQTARLNEVKERLENLKWRNTSLHEENLKLRNRLEKAEGDVKSSKNDKYRALALEEEVGQLQNRLSELEEEKAVLSSTSTRRIPKPPTSELSDKRAGRSNRRLKSPSPIRTAQSASPNRPQPSPGRLRFLRRRSRSKDILPGETGQAEKDDSSSSSKPAF